MLLPKEASSNSFPFSMLVRMWSLMALRTLFNHLIEAALIMRVELGMEILSVPCADEPLPAADVSGVMFIE
ncbi:hypothetical protein ALP50_101674 [Pseudomonas syringae pv. spinaceae]|uniref:Uncharacterized protein n=1 Tax=Pseudomonas syringae pv. primulae TaxID=251707 RepID=A0A3M3Y5B3_9PSED|nr:hypothetical protein ALQ36_102056 [Pseudomonas syringae pv. primulae]RMR12406.1 hypothetical protein ALP92_102093 [Pseudomonas syringae pv. primulae]RMT36877.1 hypothetical protein ALP50_101674 [Pseudomonas syringae pv. spinaceae]RMU42153.1 hypothetical protein ALP30_102240 [Pseudomonas syringae pv. primulae]